ncbi:MAG: alanyl-tRNA editing protein [Planctomycetes bacterium]|nr:alanyl-tRNA editing protein [Planctomycetota bacterium]
MSTTKIYLIDSNILQMTARVMDMGLQPDGRSWVSVDRSPFHPQGGGQKSDRGTIGGATVTHVMHGDGGNVLHLVEDPPSLHVGDEVDLCVDPVWRKMNSTLHTAGHLIATIVEQRFSPVRAYGAHHWPGEARVEFNLAGAPIDPARIEAELAVDLATAIDANLLVAVEGDPYTTRAIRIGSYSAIPCGGTHVSYLGVLVSVSVKKVRQKAGTLRISYDLN